MDMTHWLEYFVHGLETQLEETMQRGTRAMRRDVIVLKHGLSERQAKAIWHAMQHGELTIQVFEALCPDFNRRTLQRDLKSLVTKQLLHEVGGSATDPTRKYVPGKALDSPDHRA